MTIPLPGPVRGLIDGRTFAVLTTINPDGSPQSTVVWLKRDGDDILFSTVRGRRKTRNMERDPRVAVCAYDPEQPYSSFTVEGTVTLDERGGPELRNELSLKYDGRPAGAEAPEVVRVVGRLTPNKVISQ
jgi:PPOX class probable F420-dependent enzyme